MWVPLLEKAQAKIKGGYAKIHGGQIKESLVDLTGGIVTSLPISTTTDFKDMHKKLSGYIKKGYLLSCVQGDKRLKGRRVSDPELNRENGLLINHAQTILDVLDIQGNRIQKLKNPWGYGDWTGSLSEHDLSLTEEMKKALNQEQQEQGVFFINSLDFCRNYTKIWVCKIFNDNTDCQIISDKWERSRNGGPPPQVKAPANDKVEDERKL